MEPSRRGRRIQEESRSRRDQGRNQAQDARILEDGMGSSLLLRSESMETEEDEEEFSSDDDDVIQAASVLMDSVNKVTDPIQWLYHKYGDGVNKTDSDESDNEEWNDVL